MERPTPHSMLNVDVDVIDLTASVRVIPRGGCRAANPHQPQSDDLFQTPLAVPCSVAPSPMDAPELQHLVQQEVRRALSAFEAHVGGMLGSVSDELAAEVQREQQHLLLMQQAVDQSKMHMTRELTDMQKQIAMERTQRAYLLASIRESRDNLLHQVSSQALEIARLRRALDDRTGPLSWLWDQVASSLTCCQPVVAPAARHAPLPASPPSPAEIALKEVTRVDQLVYSSGASPARMLQSPIKAADAAVRVLSPKQSPLAPQKSAEETLIAAVRTPDC